MTTTIRSAAPALSAPLRHLRQIATGGMLALVLLGATAGLAGPASAAGGTGAGAGKVQQQDLTRKVNEYEGQHRLSVAGDPSQWGLASGKDPEISTTPGLSGQDPEYPVTPNHTRKVNEYEGQHR
jgi:hypothetical protein